MSKLDSIDLIAGERSEAKTLLVIALGTDNEVPIMHHNGSQNRRVKKVTYTPDTAITGDDTNNVILSVVNKGLLGVGTDVVATLTFATGVDGVKADGKDIPLTATLADRIILPGEVLQMEKTETGTGLALPAGDLQITYENVGNAIV